MNPSRRKFLRVAAGTAGLALATRAPGVVARPVFGGAGAPGAGNRSGRLQAVAFDAFPVFDPRPIGSLAEQLFPGRGTELTNAWRIRQFEYTWLRTVAGRHVDFWKVTEDALVWAAKSLKLELGPSHRERLLEAHLGLKPWPDAPAALHSLREAGFRLAFLSNFTPRMLGSCIQASGLEGIFEHVLSTEQVFTFKPDRRAYQLGVDAFGLRPQQVAFVAHAGWDAAGAKWFGYPTFWINRLGLPPEELTALPDATLGNLTELATALRQQ